MNIGIVTPYYPDSQTANSGLANHFSLLTKALTDMGHKVVVVHVRPAYADETNFLEKQTANEMVVLTYKVTLPNWILKKFNKKWALVDFLIKVKCMILVFNRLNDISKKYRLQIIETTSYFSLCYFYMFKTRRLPIVVRVSTTFLQMMDNFYPFKSRLQRAIGQFEIRMIKKSRYLVTHALGHALEIEKLYQINSKLFAIIPHGINLPVVTPEDVVANKPTTILYVGRFEYRKGTDILLKAIPYVLEINPSVYFQLIGHDPGGEYEKKFKELATTEFSDHVIFSGNLDSGLINQAYQACDIFVAPSRYESFGLIYIEAMSFGKPVIGSKVGGVSEIIENCINGIYAEIDNAHDLSEKILYLTSNADIRLKMGINARKTVEERFTKEKLAEKSLLYYQESYLDFKTNPCFYQL
jgi:glycosyltransferase involved in cell wall biosynthesis